jgi:hypothetical protein
VSSPDTGSTYRKERISFSTKRAKHVVNIEAALFQWLRFMFWSFLEQNFTYGHVPLFGGLARKARRRFAFSI